MAKGTPISSGRSASVARGARAAQRHPSSARQQGPESALLAQRRPVFPFTRTASLVTAVSSDLAKLKRGSPAEFLLLTEFCPGGNLMEFVQTQAAPLSPAQVVQFFSEVGCPRAASCAERLSVTREPPLFPRSYPSPAFPQRRWPPWRSCTSSRPSSSIATSRPRTFSLRATSIFA